MPPELVDLMLRVRGAIDHGTQAHRQTGRVKRERLARLAARAPQAFATAPLAPVWRAPAGA